MKDVVTNQLAAWVVDDRLEDVSYHLGINRTWQWKIIIITMPLMEEDNI